MINQEIDNTFQSKFMTYKDYLQTDHWKDTRKTKLKKSAYKCQLCSSNKKLQVHHNTYERLGYEKDTDLIVLCAQCHSRFHDIEIRKGNKKKNNKEDGFLVEVASKNKVSKRTKNENITNIYIDNNYCTDNNISNEAFLVYLGLRRLYRKGTDKYYINISLLSYVLCYNPVATRYVTSYIVKGLKDLESKGIITEIDVKKKRKNEWIYDLSKLDLNTNAKGVYYTIVNSSKITKLVQYQSKIRLRLLRFYCYMMTTVMKTKEKKGVGFTSYQDMANRFKITRQTVSKYMDKLEELKIIYIYRSNDTIVYDDGKVREISNVYGDYKNKKKIIACGIQHEREYGKNNIESIKLVSKSKAKSTRSASAKYNVILGDLAEGGKIRYDYDECKKIYETLLEFNKRYSYDEDRQKDLSIFKDYDFYEG